ncbi:Lrp/AsnC family transcriptional regulator [Pseudonocardia kunmingensis]|uniref:DNA-binding Lrp family transcriptional regulator n=1 Tax=Pseudonocardia kunmingensis TaxID=630975 RepID=A0A543DXH2_9PSEU|nr:Lrp/AsnC family transcriptional regulator [Pseudonocardia kunmingensis]TQM14032.1 DNA-binding Lrp family transcriptional regulator [Pseudonocardia kunmingensis]
MRETPKLSELDRKLVAALQVNGRASWKQVARALDATESTVARRGQQLLESGVVGVTGVLDHLRCGLGISLQVRMRSRPGTANAVAEALAVLPETRFVTVVTGSADVAAEFVVRDHHEVTRVLVEELPRPDDIVETESMVVVRKFSAVEEWDTGLLAPEATALLRADRARTGHREWSEPERLTPQEFAIARLLADDGRAGYAQLAAAVGVSESTAARRVESLVRRGCLRFRTLFETPLVGLDVEFMQWLVVEPGELENVGARLARLSSTQYVSATTGRFNLCLHGVLPGYGDLYHYMTEAVGALPGVRTADLTLQARALKRAYVRISADGTRERKT